MSHFHPPFQELLLDAYTEEADRYVRAVHVAEGLPASLRRGGNGAAELRQITQLLQEVQHIETRIAAARKAWEESGHRPGARLRGTLERVADLIANLADNLRQAKGTVPPRLTS